MNREDYIERLKKHGYRIKEDLTFLDTPHGLWIQKIVPAGDGFGLVSVLNPLTEEPVFKLTETGKRNAKHYIRELAAKRKEILDAGLDTADDTSLPDLEDIENDVNSFGINDDGEYWNGWAVTDSYDADMPPCLQIGKDFEVA